jgi:WhiB family redox-sensing transcriptional regulator
MAKAACTDWGDPELFHPGAGNSGDAAKAKAVCDGCEVREDCLEHALTHHETLGIWGGLSPRERRAKARAARNGPQKPVAAPELCGTYKGYQSHHRRGEETCQPCRDAMAAHNRVKRALPPPPASTPQCGTEAGVRGHNSRREPFCEECRLFRKRAHRRRKLSVVS